MQNVTQAVTRAQDQTIGHPWSCEAATWQMLKCYTFFLPPVVVM